MDEKSTWAKKKEEKFKGLVTWLTKKLYTPTALQLCIKIRMPTTMWLDRAGENVHKQSNRFESD